MPVWLHETVTGDFIADLPFSNAEWSTGVCRPDEVTVTLPGYFGQDLYQFMVPRKFTVTIVEDDGRVRASGVLSLPTSATDRDGVDHDVFPGAGPERLYESRYVLPYPYWPLVDYGGYPFPERDTHITGVEYGTMMKKLYQQAMSHPGGAIPVAWEPDRVGTRSQSWTAVDGVAVQEAVENISQLIGGPEFDWVPRLDDRDRLSWAFITGTDAIPELTSDHRHTWQSGGSDPSIQNLELKITPEFMCQTAIFTGGKDADRVIAALATGSELIDAGVPLIEVWDSSHSSVSEAVTLQGWADKRFSEGSAPVQYWSFDVRSEHAQTLRHGDWCEIDVYQHRTIPDGTYHRRVVEVSGTLGSDVLGVTVAGVMAW